MNEILALIFFAVYAELSDREEGSTEDEVISDLHDREHVVADIYTIFTRVLDLGIKELYGFSDDVSAIKKAMEKGPDKHAIFKTDSEKDREAQDRRE